MGEGQSLVRHIFRLFICKPLNRPQYSFWTLPVRSFHAPFWVCSKSRLCHRFMTVESRLGCRYDCPLGRVHQPTP